MGDICVECLAVMPYDAVWVVGWRRGALKKLVSVYKFERAMAGADVLANLLHQTLPVLPENLVVTSVPTIEQHIRRRGYDHAAKVAKRLARLRNLPYRQLLTRSDSYVQHAADRATRQRQIRGVFVAKGGMPDTALLIDDIYTTGATINEAAKELRRAGCRRIYVGVVARQPLDDRR